MSVRTFVLTSAYPSACPFSAQSLAQRKGRVRMQPPLDEWEEEMGVAGAPNLARNHGTHGGYEQVLLDSCVWCVSV